MPEISDHHSSWRGAAVEQLIAATVALAGGGHINVAQTLWDGDGIDLMLEGPGSVMPRMRLQVKSIGSDNNNVVSRGRAVSVVRRATFEPRADTWIVFVLIDLSALDFEKSWLVPSPDFDTKARKSAKSLHFNDGVNSRDSRWTEYRFESRVALAESVVGHLSE